jgi:hypothetical protein
LVPTALGRACEVDRPRRNLRRSNRAAVPGKVVTLMGASELPFAGGGASERGPEVGEKTPIRSGAGGSGKKRCWMPS